MVVCGIGRTRCRDGEPGSRTGIFSTAGMNRRVVQKWQSFRCDIAGPAACRRVVRHVVLRRRSIVSHSRVSHTFTPCHYRVISCHVIPCRVVSYRIRLPCHIMDMMPYCVMPCHIVSYHAMTLASRLRQQSTFRGGGGCGYRSREHCSWNRLCLCWMSRRIILTLTRLSGWTTTFKSGRRLSLWYVVVYVLMMHT